jgi:hypothetical protein
VSGRLSEARRRLLDRLARRGVPVGMAVGAAVLGGVAGTAAVPLKLSAKVLSAAGKPGAVSPSILSLARGVTPVYLTRTKLLAAGVVLAGLLTTGIGALSTAGAQGPTPADPDAAALKKYYDALRAHQAPKDRFEYKFVPVEKPLTTGDLQKVLATGDHEGWSYCGSQELAQEKTGKVTPHMVFKRPRGGLAADAGGARDAAAALGALAARGETDKDRAALANLFRQRQAAVLAEQGAAVAASREAEQRARAEAVEKERAALLDQVKRQEVEATQQRARAEAAVREAERVLRAADDKALAEKAARAAAEADQRDLHAKLLAELDRATKNAARARDAGAADKVRQRELEAMKAQYEELIRKLEAELKAKGGAGNPLAADPDKVITAVVKLTHVDGKTAAAGLAKVMPQAKVVAEATSNSITLTGPARVVTAAREAVAKIDGKPADGQDETVTIALKHTNAADVANALKGALGGGANARFTYDSASNRLIVTAPPKVIADVKKLVAELDQSKQ